MPHFVESSSSSTSDAESSPGPGFEAQRIVSDPEYAASSMPGCTEAPLSEQLEPIAVVGMGKIPLTGSSMRKVMLLRPPIEESRGLAMGFYQSVVLYLNIDLVRAANKRHGL